MNRFLHIALLFVATACGTTRSLQNSESSRVEVRTEVKTVHDTAFVELPLVVERVAVLDTVSHLENAFASSSARVSGGVLEHSLETKPVRVPVRVEKEIVQRDSIVYRDRVQTVTVEVEKKLSAWQRAKLRVGGVCFFLTIIIGLYFIITQFINLKSFLQ